jgi:hypothetical protein
MPPTMVNAICGHLDVTVDMTLNKLNARLPLVAITELLYFLGVKKWYSHRQGVFWPFSSWSLRDRKNTPPPRALLVVKTLLDDESTTF